MAVKPGKVLEKLGELSCKKQVKMTTKCHSHRPQINPWHLKEETQNTKSYSHTNKVIEKQFLVVKCLD